MPLLISLCIDKFPFAIDKVAYELAELYALIQENIKRES